MRALTEAEAVDWCKERGLEISERGLLSFPGASPLCLVIEPVSKPHQALYLANFLLSGNDDTFPGGVLWVRERGIWSEIAERVGEHVIANQRAFSGEARGLDDAPAQLFEPNERLAAQVCLAQPIVVGWDVFFVPENPDYFAFIGHDGPVCLISKNTKEEDQLMETFADWKPKVRRDYYFR